MTFMIVIVAIVHVSQERKKRHPDTLNWKNTDLDKSDIYKLKLLVHYV